MNYAIFDLHQEYCGPAVVFGTGPIVFGFSCGKSARFVLPKSRLQASQFAAFDIDDGGRFEIKRTVLSDIINLKRFRKSKARSEADRQAAGNRASFGRTRAERERDERAKRQLHEVVDQHRIEDEKR